MLVHPGETINVEVSASGAAFQQVMLVGQDPLGFYSPQSELPYRFSIHVPSKISPGTYTLTAFGLSLSKEHITSQPITIDIEIDIEQSPHLLSLRAEPSSISMDVGDRGSFSVIGQYADGSTTYLSRSTQMSVVLDRAGIVTVTADGLVTALRPGSTFVTVNGFLKIPVTVRPPVRIIPERATLAASETREFVARVSPNFEQTVTWSIYPRGAGKMDANGIYSAPEYITNRMSVTLTAHTAAGDAAVKIELLPKNGLSK
jgi:hypothetical protein